MEGKILVLKGQSRYNVLRIAADYMADAFSKQGYYVTVIDLTLEEQCERFYDEIQKKYDLIFSFQALLFDMRQVDQRTSLFSTLVNTPVFGHIMDHPTYHSFRLSPYHGDNIYVGCIDKSHVQYIEKFYPNIKHAAYLPHAGFKAKNIIPYEKRTIDLYFPCSYIDPVVILRQIENMPEVYQKMAKILIRNMIENPMINLHDALYSYLSQINFWYSQDEFTELMGILEVVDQYIRAYMRDECIQSLLANEIHVTVSGKGWGELHSEFKNNLDILATAEGLDFLGVLEVMGNAKMVLNHLPTYQNGMHERIFSSMMCGAICLTNDFPILREEFTDGENIILYSNPELQLLVDRLKKIYALPDKAKEIAEKGQNIASQSHTWEVNAKEVLKIVGLKP